MIPINYYSCQNCGKEFKLKEETTIDIDFYPVCSNRCEFMIIYKWIKILDYSDKNLLVMLQNIKKKAISSPFNRQDAIFSISKYYVKLGLSNVKVLLTLDIDKNNETRRVSSATLDKKTPLSYNKGLSNDLSNHFVKNKNNKCQKKKEVIEKWF